MRGLKKKRPARWRRYFTPDGEPGLRGLIITPANHGSNNNGNDESGEAYFPLVAMGIRLQRSRDELASAISTKEEGERDQDYKELRASARILLGECETMLMQLEKLEFKGEEIMLMQLGTTNLLADCEEILLQLEMLHTQTGNQRKLVRAQALVRCQLQRRRYDRTLASILMIQCISRGWLVRSRCRLLKMNGEELEAEQRRQEQRHVSIREDRNNIATIPRAPSRNRQPSREGSRARRRSRSRESKEDILALPEERMKKLGKKYFKLSKHAEELTMGSPEHSDTKRKMKLVSNELRRLYKESKMESLYRGSKSECLHGDVDEDEEKGEQKAGEKKEEYDTIIVTTNQRRSSIICTTLEAENGVNMHHEKGSKKETFAR